jgi:hypothetical protein
VGNLHDDYAVVKVQVRWSSQPEKGSPESCGHLLRGQGELNVAVKLATSTPRRCPLLLFFSVG